MHTVQLDIETVFKNSKISILKGLLDLDYSMDFFRAALIHASGDIYEFVGEEKDFSIQFYSQSQQRYTKEFPCYRWKNETIGEKIVMVFGIPDHLTVYCQIGTAEDSRPHVTISQLTSALFTAFKNRVMDRFDFTKPLNDFSNK
jgi:hypothetical protein